MICPYLPISPRRHDHARLGLEPWTSRAALHRLLTRQVPRVGTAAAAAGAASAAAAAASAVELVRALLSWAPADRPSAAAAASHRFLQHDASSGSGSAAAASAASAAPAASTAAPAASTAAAAAAAAEPPLTLELGDLHPAAAYQAYVYERLVDNPLAGGGGRAAGEGGGDDDGSCHAAWHDEDDMGA